ncbi:class I SAM-dependent methyltransferase [Actinomycetospora straminea]|uniref:Methyltransferase domain-containing protein n=1 Tax=Actinomycetospora straminea TaxID=663607 RepID=A0ABP9FBD2_9PSEU|nr:methyltransferase domain-containing protein [Actinomycetospora straminea]MDD7936337.1 methyltransferase domain-containing protein [Actinomycetospora straminea]
MDGESARWVGSMPEVYEQCLATPVFRPFARELARRTSHAAPGRVLELAAGTGAVTRELVAVCPHAEITATDLNAAMVELAASRVPGPTWRAADAARLPYPDAAFEAVVCGFGVMFLPDRRAAYAEVARVLVPGGRFLFTTWDRLATHGYGLALALALDRVFPGDVPAFLEAVPHGYHDTAQVAADVRAAGLDVVATETLTLEGLADDARQIAVGFCTGSPLRADLERRGDLDTTVDRVAAEMTEALGEGPVAAAMSAHLVEAERPRP